MRNREYDMHLRLNEAEYRKLDELAQKAGVRIGNVKTVAVDIYFTGIGLFTVPDSEELSALIAEFSKHSA